jgi:hypothetical protein
MEASVYDPDEFLDCEDVEASSASVASSRRSSRSDEPLRDSQPSSRSSSRNGRGGLEGSESDDDQSDVFYDAEDQMYQTFADELTLSRRATTVSDATSIPPTSVFVQLRVTARMQALTLTLNKDTLGTRVVHVVLGRSDIALDVLTDQQVS